MRKGSMRQRRLCRFRMRRQFENGVGGGRESGGRAFFAFPGTWGKRIGIKLRFSA